MDIFSPKGRFSRRSFIKTTAQVGAVLSFPTIIPSSALARQGRIGPNDKIRIANIGVGGMGRGHISEDTIAVCDVDKNHLSQAVDRAKDAHLDAFIALAMRAPHPSERVAGRA